VVLCILAWAGDGKGQILHTFALRRRHSSQAREVYFLPGLFRRVLGSSTGAVEDIQRDDCDRLQLCYLST